MPIWQFSGPGAGRDLRWARVQEDAGGKLDLVFEDLGEQQLKNIARPVRAYRVIAAARPAMARAGPDPALPNKPSIAVLPFANMSGDPEQEYFVDGMVEEINRGSRWKSNGLRPHFVFLPYKCPYSRDGASARLVAPPWARSRPAGPIIARQCVD